MAKKEPTKLTIYLSDDLNEPIEWLRFKSKKSKNKIVREALEAYLPKQLKKYPGFEGAKNE